MKQITFVRITLCVVLLLGSSFVTASRNAFGQESDSKASVAQQSAGKDTIQREADRQAKRQQLLARIEQVKYKKMKEVLVLDDETARKFFAIYKPAEKSIQNVVKQRNDALEQLTIWLTKSDIKLSPELLDPAMGKIHDLNKQMEDKMSELDENLKPVLSSVQRARLLVFEHDFHKLVQQEVLKNRLGRNMMPEMKQLRQQLHEQSPTK